MDVMDMLRRSGGVDAIAKQLGIPPATAAAGAEAMVPAIVGGFRKQGEAAGGGDTGLGSLIGMLGTLGGGGLAANVLGPEPTDTARGNEVLGQIFGSKDVSRTVAGHAAGQTGIDPALLKQMLPILAMLVGGYLSARAQGGGAESPPSNADGGGLGGLGSILGSMFGGSKAGATPSGGGFGGLGSLIDMNGDGNPLDDILNMAGKLGR
ncbi:MAG TPA: DUF937 domain-containing protein [Novosphingobium sp.]|nr:DUF937 domain-containing protein [Novosphingobium sp.]